MPGPGSDSEWKLLNVLVVKRVADSKKIPDMGSGGQYFALITLIRVTYTVLT